MSHSAGRPSVELTNMHEFETEADTLLLEPEAALFEARGPKNPEPTREVAVAFRRAADAAERMRVGRSP